MRRAVSTLARAGLGVLFLLAAPAGAQITLDELGDELLGQLPDGLTIITHGFQSDFAGSGDSLLPLAQAIHALDLADTGYLIDLDITGGDGTNDGGQTVIDEAQSVLPKATDSDVGGEVALLFDWRPGSNETSFGWAEAAGDALFATTIALELVDPALSSSPLHFIGHSFGAAVTSEAIERMAAWNIPVDHLTYLDPHDFDQNINPSPETEKRQWSLGAPFKQADPADRNSPDAYGATVWDNVAFADTYYQTRGADQGGANDSVVPRGRPIPGAFNDALTTELPVPASYDFFDFSGDHTWVWNCFYRGTVAGALARLRRPHPNGARRAMPTAARAPRSRFDRRRPSSEPTRITPIRWAPTPLPARPWRMRTELPTPPS